MLCMAYTLCEDSMLSLSVNPNMWLEFYTKSPNKPRYPTTIQREANLARAYNQGKLGSRGPTLTYKA